MAMTIARGLGGCLLVFAFAAISVAATDAYAGSECGKASWYALTSKTASGEYADPSTMTAAHPSLPFGTKVRVINLRNNRSVVVRINDRGPFVGGRIIDVTKAAAQKLGFVNAGVTRVRVEVLDRNGLGRAQTACS